MGMFLCVLKSYIAVFVNGNKRAEEAHVAFDNFY